METKDIVNLNVLCFSTSKGGDEKKKKIIIKIMKTLTTV